MTLQDYINQVQFLLHDQTNADFTVAELTNAINNARNAVARDFHCVRQTFISPPLNSPYMANYNAVSVIPFQEVYPLLGPNGLNGQVVGANITNGGSGYTSSATITFGTGPAGSIQATGTPVISNGVITGINMTSWGQGYNPNGNLGSTQAVIGTSSGGGGRVLLQVASAANFNIGDTVVVSGVGGTTEANGTWTIGQLDPTHIGLNGTVYANAWTSGGTVVNKTTVVIIISSPGVGGIQAAATSSMFNNVFNVISISYIWNQQRYMLRFRAFTLFQAYMRPMLTFNQRAMIWTIQEQAGLVLIQPPPDQSYVSEWDVLCLPMPLVNTTDVDMQVIYPWADAVQYYAAQLCLSKLQNFQQAEYYLKLYSAIVPRIIIGAGGVRIPNPYHKTYQRRVSR